MSDFREKIHSESVKEVNPKQLTQHLMMSMHLAQNNILHKIMKILQCSWPFISPKHEKIQLFVNELILRLNNQELAYWLRRGIRFPPRWQLPLRSSCFPGVLCRSHCQPPAAAAAAAGPACPCRPAAWSGQHLALRHRSGTATRWAARQIRSHPTHKTCNLYNHILLM